jgi:hypothetical protein
MKSVIVLCWAVLTGAAVLSGCAVKNTYRFADVQAALSASGTQTVAVAVVDRREYVVSGEKEPSFVGLMRGGYGNPFNVRTASGKPLAATVNDAVCSSLRAKGYDPVPVQTVVGENDAEVRNKLGATASKLGLLVDIHHWKSDTYVDVILGYRLAVRVLSPAGETLATHEVEADENLKGSAMNPPKYARKVIPEAFKKSLESLLNQEQVAAALGNPAPAPAAALPETAENSLLGGLSEASASRTPLSIPDICETVEAMNRVNKPLRDEGKIPQAHPDDVKSTQGMLAKCAEKKSDDNQCRVFLFLYDENPSWAVGDHPDDDLEERVADTREKCHHNEAALCKTKIWLLVTQPPADPTKVAVLEVEAEECKEFLIAIEDPDYLNAPVAAPAVVAAPVETPASPPPGPEPEQPAATQPAMPLPAVEYTNMRQLKDAIAADAITPAEFRQHQLRIRQMRAEELNQLKQDRRARKIDEWQYEQQVEIIVRKYEGD